MKTCTRCCSIIRQLHQDQPSTRDAGEIDVTLPILRYTTVRECWICYKFFQWLKANDPGLLKAWRRRRLRVKFITFGQIILKKPQQNTLLPLFIDIVPSRYRGHESSCEVELNFVPTAEFIGYSQSPPILCSKLRVNLSIVNKWLDICTKGHQKCREERAGWFPTRLLHLVPQSPKAKLIISKDHSPSGPYMTLSYRWGRRPNVILKSTTIQQLQNAINIADLPLIFQDVITVAIHLGIHYLWIDALCIKQDEDDRSDWENESQNMEKIYSCAFLNLSATMSLDGSESLMRHTPFEPFYPSEIELEAFGSLQKFFIIDGDVWLNEIDNAPLTKRGWVFQERLLARRILHFGQHQLGWECRELTSLEMFPNGFPRATAMSFLAKPKIETIMEALAQNRDQVSDFKFTELWQLLVHAYSKCALTERKDKLIALSGVAKRLMRIRDDRYVAGMWKKTMVYDLGWWRPTEVRLAYPISETVFRAPSWSWASVDGEILFPSTCDGVKALFAEIEEVPEPTTIENKTSTTGNPIRVRGYCLPLSFEWPAERIINFKAAGIRFDVDDSVSGSLMSIEIPKQEAQDLLLRGNLLLLPLFATPYFIHGIVLTKSRGVRAHRRIGAVEIPVVRGTGITTSEAIRGGTGEDKQRYCLQRDGWVRESHQPTNQSIPMDYLWSLAAVKFYQYLLDAQPARRIIDIY